MMRLGIAVGILVGACGADASPGSDAGAPPSDASGRDAGPRPGEDGGSGAPCVPIAARRISDAVRAYGKPAVAWTGDGYGVVFHDNRDGTRQVFLAVVGADGIELGSDVQLTHEASDASLSDLVWDGTRYAISYHTFMPATAHFARFGIDGEPVGASIQLGAGASSSLAWTGSSYGCAYESWVSAGDIYFRMVGGDGALGAETAITEGGAPSIIPSLGWTGTEFGMVFLGAPGGGIYFARASATGAEVGTEARIEGADDGGVARLAAASEGYLVTRGTALGGRLAKLDASGARDGADVPVGQGPSEAIWDGSRYAVAYAVDGETLDGDVMLATYDPDDAAASEPILVSTGTASGGTSISLAWNGSGYAVAWSHSLETSGEVYFAVVCPP